ncbi:pyridine nucleotide-disulfide oxidoreductase [Cereibacter johrii]|uniref:Pyridine nucleotide-disulfide oxidoreductase n=1 Tax=Cereibacter johrii TaxID=445629 RepID=A0ABX5J9U3_9RHOB|nr:FAD-dependent oxidoreductase [Cereibacter johrii]PTM78243.1 pyridine nucleotide-disulfide oxidoreductase [Cereibacter johrii]
MQSLSRRHFTLGLAAAAAGFAAGGAALALRPGQRVLVVGGGPAGAEAALALRAAHPRASVLLIERDPTRLAREPDEAGLAGFLRPRAEAGLAALKAAGVGLALDEVVSVDWAAGRAVLFSGRDLAFDRLLLAPGTAPRDEAIPGLDAVARHAWPAAWGSPREARRLLAGLQALPERGHVVLRLPEGEAAHPAAALGRALALASHVARRPGARLTVLDGTEGADLAQAFAARTPAEATGRVEWVSAARGGRVRAVDTPRGLIETEAGTLRADVVNFVPALRAGAIAAAAGLADASGWCPCDAAGRSVLRPEALVLGDARKAARRTVAEALRSARAATDHLA